ncbi:MAG TPA: transcriptional regulator [Streptosporangiaceae bacterium]|jgi:predicted DNA-binding transcriptional regulator YafY
MRASRLVSVLLLLQTRGRMTAQQLADTLEVSVRTIYRDIGSLSAAGVPVYGDAGPAGGYQLVDGYRTRLTGLTAAEAQALALAGVPAAAAELGLGTLLSGAQLKLLAALPGPLRDQAGVVGDRFHLDAQGWYQDGDQVPQLAGIARAVWDQQRIRVRYSRWAAPAEVTRVLDPHGIVLKAGKWYLIARHDGSMRTYRINQVLSVTALGERFTREPGFDLPSHWEASVAGFHAWLRRGEATIRLSPAGRQRARGLLGPAAGDAVDAAAGPGPDGWVTVVVPIESAERAPWEFLSLGAEVEVLAPASVRAELAGIARSMAGIYAS